MNQLKIKWKLWNAYTEQTMRQIPLDAIMSPSQEKSLVIQNHEKYHMAL